MGDSKLTTNMCCVKAQRPISAFVLTTYCLWTVHTLQTEYV